MKLDPHEISLSAIVVAMFFCETLNKNEINSWGNWFTLVGQYLETYAAFIPNNNQNKSYSEE